MTEKRTSSGNNGYMILQWPRKIIICCHILPHDLFLSTLLDTFGIYDEKALQLPYMILGRVAGITVLFFLMALHSKR